MVVVQIEHGLHAVRLAMQGAKTRVDPEHVWAVRRLDSCRDNAWRVMPDFHGPHRLRHQTLNTSHHYGTEYARQRSERVSKKGRWTPLVPLATWISPSTIFTMHRTVTC